MAKQIPLSQGKFAIVDDDDYDWLNQWKWTYHRQGYAYRMTWPEKKSILMHRVLLNTSEKMYVDHINRDKLDNRRENLRNCTPHENGFNRPKNKNNKGKYKGVYFMKRDGIWVAQIRFSPKTIYLGRFKTQEAAAIAYDKAAIELFGEHASLNGVAA